MLIFIILCMMISPLMSIPILCVGLYHDRNRLNKGYAIPFALLFGTLGYNLKFIADADLTRYYTMIDRLEGQGLNYIFSTDKERLYTRDFLFYFVSKTGNNSILAYIVGFCCYLIMFYIFFDTVSRYRDVAKPNCNIHIALIGILMVSIINPFSIVSNVRCVFSYFLITLAAYREWIQKKRNLFTILLYIIPLGLHISSVIILGVRIIIPFIKKFSKIFVTVVILVPILIRFMYEIFRKFTGDNYLFILIKNVINKAYAYLNWTSGGWADEIENSLSNRIERIYGVFFLIIIIIFYYAIEKDRKVNLDIKIHNYLYMIAILAIGCLSIKTGAFWRFESIVVGFSPLILMPIAMAKKNNYNRILLPILYASACVMLVLNIIRFARNIIMDEFMIGYISTSTLQIIGEIIKGIVSIV